MAHDALKRLEAAQAALDSSTLATQPWSPDLVGSLVWYVLGFGVIGLVLASILMYTLKAPAENIIRVFGLLSIISVSAILLVVGYSNEQLTPIIGLFGAIAGYLLGKEGSPPKPPGG